jgi:hypothetical protein
MGTKICFCYEEIIPAFHTITTESKQHHQRGKPQKSQENLSQDQDAVSNNAGKFSTGFTTGFRGLHLNRNQSSVDLFCILRFVQWSQKMLGLYPVDTEANNKWCQM